MEDLKNVEKINKLSSMLGTIYYKYVPEVDDFYKLRIVRIYNEETIGVIAIGAVKKSITKMKFKILAENFTMLIPDAKMTVSNVVALKQEDREIKDVVIMVYKNHNNTFTGKIEPDIVCRQSISDVFCQINGNTEMVGISVSQNTCPADYSIQDFMMADAVIDFKILNIYKTDTLNDFFLLIGPKYMKKCNNILKQLLEDRYTYTCKVNPLYERVNSKCPDTLDGYCKNLHDLLVSNEFMYDYQYLFRMISVKFKINYDKNTEENHLTEDQKHIISRLFEENMEETILLKYEYDLELDKFKMPYVLIMDNTHTVYVVGYAKSKSELVMYIDPDHKNKEVDDVNTMLANAVDYYNKYQ